MIGMFRIESIEYLESFLKNLPFSSVLYLSNSHTIWPSAQANNHQPWYFPVPQPTYITHLQVQLLLLFEYFSNYSTYFPSIAITLVPAILQTTTGIIWNNLKYKLRKQVSLAQFSLCLVFTVVHWDVFNPKFLNHIMELIGVI